MEEIIAVVVRLLWFSCEREDNDSLILRDEPNTRKNDVSESLLKINLSRLPVK